MEEVLDEVVLEDPCCHSQKLSILVPPDFPKIPATVLANPAVHVSMLSSFLDHLVSTDIPRTTMGTKLSYLQGTILFFVDQNWVLTFVPFI